MRADRLNGLDGFMCMQFAEPPVCVQVYVCACVFVRPVFAVAREKGREPFTGGGAELMQPFYRMLAAERQPIADGSRAGLV